MLVSGYHSDTFFMFRQIARYPHYMSKISREMLGWIDGSDVGHVDVVLSTSRAGMQLAYNIASELKTRYPVRAAYSECNDAGGPVMKLLDGFHINRGEKVVVVNDVCTTGSGLETLANLCESHGGKVVGVSVFANRAQSQHKLHNIIKRYAFHSIVDLNMHAWKEKDTPAYVLSKTPIFSRELNSLISDKSYEEIFGRNIEAA